MTERRERPQAFRLDDPRMAFEARETEEVAPSSGLGLDDDAPPAVRAAERRGFSWGALFWGAVGALVSLGIGLGVDALVRDLFARADWLGWLGTAAAGLLALAALGIALNEVVGMFRLRRVARLRREAEAVMMSGDPAAARAVVRHLLELYADRPDTARGRRALKAELSEIMDAADLLAVAERELLLTLDLQARRMTMESARRVSVVTAISPRAVLDVLFVLAESLRLVRRLSTLYGGRPGALGLLRLMRAVLTHLAATGALALGDSLVQQLLGHGLAARVSARLGEGIVNGLLTGRVGLAAILVCRPLPFVRAAPTRISDVMAEMAKRQADA